MRIAAHLRSRSARATALICATAATTLLAACGAGSSAASDGESSADGQAGLEYAEEQVALLSEGIPLTEVEPLADVPDMSGKTVWFIPISNAPPVMAAMGRAIESALGELGASVHVCDGNFQPTAIASCLNQASTRDAAAVITGFVDYALVPTAFDEVADAGIPVLLAGAVPTGGRESDDTLAFYSPEPRIRASGAAQAYAAMVDSEGTANILYVNLTDQETGQMSTEAAGDAIEEYCPGCSFETVDMQSSKIDQLASSVSAALVANPDIDYVMNPVGVYVPQIVQGINSAGAGQRVKVISGTAELAGLQRIAAGQYQIYDIGSHDEMGGWKAADALLRLMSGAEVGEADESGLKLFHEGNIGDLELTPDNHGTSAWYGGDEWKDLFREAWGL